MTQYRISIYADRQDRFARCHSGLPPARSAPPLRGWWYDLLVLSALLVLVVAGFLVFLVFA